MNTMRVPIVDDKTDKMLFITLILASISLGFLIATAMVDHGEYAYSHYGDPMIHCYEAR